MSTARALQTDEAELLAANAAFYEAMQDLDLNKMIQMWCHEDWVSCLHPGWDLLVGWEEVKESWANIFRSTHQMRVTATRPFAHAHGDVGWISCIENVTSTYESGFETAMVEATNLFLRRNGEWRMVHHHSTLLPDRVPAGTSRSVQ